MTILYFLPWVMFAILVLLCALSRHPHIVGRLMLFGSFVVCAVFVLAFGPRHPDLNFNGLFAGLFILLPALVAAVTLLIFSVIGLIFGKAARGYFLCCLLMNGAVMLFFTGHVLKVEYDKRDRAESRRKYNESVASYQRKRQNKVVPTARLKFAPTITIEPQLDEQLNGLATNLLAYYKEYPERFTKDPESYHFSESVKVSGFEQYCESREMCRRLRIKYYGASFMSVRSQWIYVAVDSDRDGVLSSRRYIDLESDKLATAVAVVHAYPAQDCPSSPLLSCASVVAAVEFESGKQLTFVVNSKTGLNR